MAEMPVPRKNSAIILRRLQWSASQPNGSAKIPMAAKAAQDSVSKLAIGRLIDGLEPDHHGRKDQDHIVIEQMTDVEKANRADSRSAYRR